MPYLKFISNHDLITAVSKVIKVIEKAEHDAETNMYKNVIDPFSALFHGITKSISYKDWLKQEKARQTQKTMQNSIGDFQQDILGSISGWKNLGVGGGLDVINEKMKIIAEVKNKYNTTKGNHLVKLYDDIKNTLKNNRYEKYTGYYVEVISKGRKKYDKPFIPSEKGKRRPAKNKIRVIDGVSFYAMATGRKKALQELFDVLPQVIADKHKYKLNKKEAKEYHELFKMAFSTE
ncbi:MAG: Eco47II family restriction endonuclease [Candidatus Magasanikbacteria bacterium CG10_big_fil_rev_8_21_14_0_10_36_16]|uniref:Eco47II family restriction endonuclease n=1 Tax=Candidatus Magasanikbacteria bacterium CG10_big_fil_rev_8_21_14_0_10_36_16 TaxID=1974645 RepID=A0A2H0TZI0_9BACT|nr:MAG: Eco47II family restriction endonuclease [Candidatus Magasanikbacteria bacterium CG10_big_fil_rev_8_21_14_0_10_36_16]